MDFLLVAVGGALGSTSRYLIGRALAANQRVRIPFGTMAVNISGALLLGWLSVWHPAGSLYVLLGDGFLGAFTTFSTFMYEGFILLTDHKRLNAAIYIAGSLLLGLLGFMAGAALARLLLLP